MRRLVDELADAELRGLLAIAMGIRRRHDDDRRVGEGRAFADGPEHREAVVAREIDVEQHEIGRGSRRIGEHGQRVFAVPRDLQLAVDPVLPERLADQEDVRLVVFGEEDPGRPRLRLSCDHGTSKKNVEPLPGADSTQILPP